MIPGRKISIVMIFFSPLVMACSNAGDDDPPALPEAEATAAEPEVPEPELPLASMGWEGVYHARVSRERDNTEIWLTLDQNEDVSEYVLYERTTDASSRGLSRKGTVAWDDFGLSGQLTTINSADQISFVGDHVKLTTVNGDAAPVTQWLVRQTIYQGAGRMAIVDRAQIVVQGSQVSFPVMINYDEPRADGARSIRANLSIDCKMRSTFMPASQAFPELFGGGIPIADDTAERQSPTPFEGPGDPIALVADTYCPQ